MDDYVEVFTEKLELSVEWHEGRDWCAGPCPLVLNSGPLIEAAKDVGLPQGNAFVLVAKSNPSKVYLDARELVLELRTIANLIEAAPEVLCDNENGDAYYDFLLSCKADLHPGGKVRAIPKVKPLLPPWE